MSNDSLKIRAAAFAVRAGHSDQVAEDFVTELCQMGVLGRTDRYGEVLANLMRNAGRGESAWVRLVNSQGSDEHLKLCNDALAEVQAETRRRATKAARETIGPRTYPGTGEAETTQRYVAGWHDACDYIEKEGR